MARTSMADLIARLRTVVGDPAGDLQTFEDDELEAFLDERRIDVVEAQLRVRPAFGEDNLLVFTDYFTPWRDWEDSVVLRDYQGTVLTSDSDDLIAGHWTFTDGQVAPVFITGSAYDLYGSARTVLEAWAARVAREFNFATDQQRFDRSQKREGLLAVAREFARRTLPARSRPAWRSQEW